MENTISDTQLLIIRHLKKNKVNDNILKKLVGKYYAFYPDQVTKQMIFHCLFDIVEKFDLFPHTKRGRYFFTDGEFWEPDFDDVWDCWIYRAKSIISVSEVSKFPRYPTPAWFTNKHNRKCFS